MMQLSIEAVSLVAPGLRGWESSRTILTGESEYQAAPIASFSPEILPPNERRRITPTIRIALQAATEAMLGSSFAPHDTLTVFASDIGDLDISDRICAALTLTGHPVSPTDFHNSVHNAPAGYWAIGNTCRLPSTSLSAGRASFAAGLLEAATQALSNEHPVLLVCYGFNTPAALTELCQVDHPFAVGMLMHNQCSANRLGEFTMQIVEAIQPTTELRNQALAPLLHGNSAALCLPLLETIACDAAGSCRLPYLTDKDLLLEFLPC